MVTPQIPNMSALAFQLLLPQWRVGHGATRGLTEDDLDRVEATLDACGGRGRPRRPRRGDGGLVLDEIRATVGVLRLACRDARLRLAGDGILASVPPADRARLAGELDAVIDEHRRLWTQSFRPGGLDDSVAWFEHLARATARARPTRSWFGPVGLTCRIDRSTAPVGC